MPSLVTWAFLQRRGQSLAYQEERRLLYVHGLAPIYRRVRPSVRRTSHPSLPYPGATMVRLRGRPPRRNPVEQNVGAKCVVAVVLLAVVAFVVIALARAAVEKGS